jgi:TPR repeat protein
MAWFAAAPSPEVDARPVIDGAVESPVRSALASLLVFTACGAASHAHEPEPLEAPWVTREAACYQGDNLACYDAAGWYSGEPSQYPNPDAQGPPADLVHMVEILEHACERHDHDACDWMLSVVLVQPELTSSAGVDRRLGAACDGGDGLSCVVLGVVLESSSEENALAAYRAGCRAAEREGCFRAAMLLREEDPAASRTLLSEACGEHDQWGCLEYGQALTDGVGGAVDRETARTVLGWVCALDREKAESRGGALESEACALLASLD